MPTQFQIKRSTVSGVRPTTSNIQPGELGINIQDGILFSANATTVFEVGGNLTSIAVGNSTSRVTVNTTSIFVSNGITLNANGSNGSSGQVLTSNGTGLYWSTPGAGSVNTSAQYTWTNVHTFNANVVFSAGISANGGYGSIRQVLTSNGSGGVYWSSIASAVRQSWTANSTVNTTFTVSGGYVPNQIDVYRNGVKLVNGTDVTVSSGSTVVLAEAAYDGDSIEVVGSAATAQSVNTADQYTWSNLHTFQANLHTGNSTVNAQVSNAVLTINNSNTATLNASSIGFGNASVNAVYGLTTFSINGVTIANSTGANNAFNLGGVAAASYVNTSGAYTITGIHTYQANIIVGNTTVNAQYSNAAILISNATSTTTVGLADIRIGNTTTNVVISNTVSTFGGNVAITGVANVTGNVTLGSSAFFVGNGTLLTTLNATSMTVGTLPWGQAPTNTVNTTGSFTITGLDTFQANLHTGNSTVNTQLSNSIFTINNSNTATLNASSLSFGNASVNAVYGLAAFTLNGATIANTTGANNSFNLGGVAAASYVNTSGAYTITGIHTYQANIIMGNTTVNTQLSNASILISNSTSTTTVGLADIRIGNTTSNVVLSNTGSNFSANVNFGGQINVASKIQIGTPGAFDFGQSAEIEIDASANGYIQVVIQNANTGNNSSSDLVVTNDSGNDTTNFVDLGINGSNYNQAGFNIGGAGDGYLYTSNGALTIGTATAKELIFHANGTTSADRKLTVNSAAITIANSVALVANGSNGAAGDVLTSNGTGVYWSTLSAGSVNTAAQYSWTNLHNFSANLHVGNSTVNTQFSNGLIGLTSIAANVSVTAPANNTLFIFSREYAGHDHIAYKNSDGFEHTLQSSIGRNSVAFVQPVAGATTVTAVGMATTNTLALVARTPASTSLYTGLKRVGVTSSGSTGSSAELRGTVNTWYRGNATGAGGFWFIAKFGIAVPSTNYRFFVGLKDNTAVLGNTNPSAQTNIIGVGIDSTQTTMRIITNGSAGTAPTIDLGASFPTNTGNTNVYEVSFFAPPNGSFVNYTVTRLNTGDVTSGTITANATNLPASTVFMSPKFFVNSGSDATAVSLDMCSLYIETDL